MTGPIHAHVRRVLTGHSDRAFVHAVDDAGLEYKIEVPIEAVRGVNPDQGHILVVSWSFQAGPRPAEPAVTPASTESPATTPPRSATPSVVDQAFMELMARPRTPAAPAATGPSSGSASTRNASDGLAELLGVKRT